VANPPPSSTSSSTSTSSSSTPASGGLEGSAQSSLEGWAAFRRAINVTLPALLSEAESIETSTARLLAGIG
jgi:hypothetical protein